VSLGSAARNLVKIKVRQPLAELKVQPADERDRRAVERFSDQITDELNLKKVTLHDAGNGALLRKEIRPNMKTLGPRFSARLKEVLAALASADAAEVAARVSAGEPFELPTASGPVTLEPGDVIVECAAPEGWSGLTDRGTQVALDTCVTEELALEGMAREVVRHVQQARKDANLEMEDRIVLYLHTESPRLQKAIGVHREYIGNETLVAQWSSTPLRNDAFKRNVKVEGQTLRIELRKV
jgi:isoleucyl-tRNA synthetase